MMVHLENATLAAATVMCSIGLNGFTFPNLHESIKKVRAVSIHRTVFIILLDPFQLDSTKKSSIYKLGVYDARIGKGGSEIRPDN